MTTTLQLDVTSRFLETLNESQTRWFLAREAMHLGYGGIKKVCELTGVTKPTVIKGMKELKSGKRLNEGERIRHPGAGRRKIEEKQPEISNILKAIMEETTAGDPMSLLRWTSKSTYQISAHLKKSGYIVSADTVGRRIKEMGYSLQANVKNWEGFSHADRDNQFRYINALAKKYVKKDDPIISVDTKKKEKIGNFKNSGRKWRKKGDSKSVNAYDFPSLSEGNAIPYGAYDVQKNYGLVNVGISHDTAEFAVGSIRQWWNYFGKKYYPKAKRILICADGGGSNGSRNRAWKFNLQKLSDKLGVSITVCHYPPGTSKWNKIEHRMFSFISINWKGEPLINYETVINMISSTTTKTGLKIKALLDKKQYETGIKISDEQLNALNLKFHQINSQWNYTIEPRKE